MPQCGTLQESLSPCSGNVQAIDNTLLWILAKCAAMACMKWLSSAGTFLLAKQGIPGKQSHLPHLPHCYLMLKAQIPSSYLAALASLHWLPRYHRKRLAWPAGTPATGQCRKHGKPGCHHHMRGHRHSQGGRHLLQHLHSRRHHR